MPTITMEDKHLMFNHLSQAVRFINQMNPARSKPINLLENGSSSGRSFDPDFTGQSKQDVFASLVLGLKKTLALHNEHQQRAWKLRNLGDSKKHLHPRDISSMMGVSPKTIYRWLNSIDDDLEREYKKRELLPKD